MMVHWHIRVAKDPGPASRTKGALATTRESAEYEAEVERAGIDRGKPIGREAWIEQCNAECFTPRRGPDA